MAHATRSCSLLTLLLLGAPCFSVLAHAERCIVDLVVLNRDRRVTGGIEAECGGDGHSAPFGNWGVNLNFHQSLERRDRFQFSGWRAKEGWLQWNSCTTADEFSPGDPEYYNYDNFSTQRAWPDIVNISHALSEFTQGALGQNCEDLFKDDKVSIRNVQMLVYELDPTIIFPDTRVATLLYGTVEVPYVCTDPWLCSGKSEWMRPISGNENVHAELQIQVHLRKKE